MYRQGIPDIELFIEQDTSNTPEPKAFYVLHKQQIMGSYRTLKAAQKLYSSILQQTGYKPQPLQTDNSSAIAQEMQDKLMMRKELYWSKSTSYRTTRKRR